LLDINNNSLLNGGNNLDKIEIIRRAENAILWLENAERAVVDAKEDIIKLIEEAKK